MEIILQEEGNVILIADSSYAFSNVYYHSICCILSIKKEKLYCP